MNVTSLVLMVYLVILMEIVLASQDILGRNVTHVYLTFFRILVEFVKVYFLFILQYGVPCPYTVIVPEFWTEVA